MLLFVRSGSCRNRRESGSPISFGGRTQRFGKLQSALPQVTRKVLTQQLRELEDDGVVIRTAYPQVPPKVEYSLSDKPHVQRGPS